MIRERDIESYLSNKIKKLGGMCLKWNGQQGVPDRIIMLRHGMKIFVELKAPNGKLSALQKNMHRKMEILGTRVVVLWSKEDVDEFIYKLEEELELIDEYMENNSFDAFIEADEEEGYLS